MKLLISFLFIYGLYIQAAGFNENMDKKSYYDADRTQQDEYEKMSKDLKLFIKDQVSDKMIQDYKHGDVVLSAEELEYQEDYSDEQENQSETNTTDKQPSFFSKMMEKIGMGSTKKTEPKIEDNQPSFFSKMMEKIGIGSTKKIEPEIQEDLKTTEDEAEVKTETQINPTQEVEYEAQ